MSDAQEWRFAFADGDATTVLELDPGGRVRVYGYDGDDLIHCTSHSIDTAKIMADALRHMTSHADRGRRKGQ
ncbi:hypothetical protein [Nocardia sp. NPDC057030]|uniref:hypothetical protein n=1 Tax=unclassified Nocardia TaxID=2637762 RepID=UPI003631897A